MKTIDFIEKLNANENLDIHFEYEEGQKIPVGFHLTEVIKAERESMDCGGVFHEETRNIIQLHARPTDQAEKQLKTNKFSHILKTANTKLNFPLDAEVFVEFGSDDVKTATYHIGEIKVDQNDMLVQLHSTVAVCKPAVAVACGDGSSSCC